MQLRTLTALDGWRWLGAGFALFRRNPAMLTLLMLTSWMTLLLINQIPLIGWPLASALIPAFTAGLMSICREIDGGRLPPPGTLFSGFLQAPRPLLVLGVIYVVTFLFAFAASAIVDGGDFLQTMVGLREPTEQEIATGAFMVPMQITLLVLLPSMMAMWFAPMLVAWHVFTPDKALFFSFVACLRNWLPFLTYGLCMVLFGAILPGLLLGIALSVLPLPPKLAVAVCMLPIIFILAPSVTASFYVSYRDVFRDDDLPPPVIDEQV